MVGKLVKRPAYAKNVLKGARMVVYKVMRPNNDGTVNKYFERFFEAQQYAKSGDVIVKVWNIKMKSRDIILKLLNNEKMEYNESMCVEVK
jgi:hypothetical protein